MGSDNDVNVRDELDVDDNIIAQNRGFIKSVRSRYFRERLIESIERVNDNVIITFVDHNPPQVMHQLTVPLPFHTAVLSDIAIAGLTDPIMNRNDLVGTQAVTAKINTQRGVQQLQVWLQQDMGTEQTEVQRSMVADIDNFKNNIDESGNVTFNLTIGQDDVAVIPDGDVEIKFVYLITQDNAMNQEQILMRYEIEGIVPPMQASLMVTNFGGLEHRFDPDHFETQLSANPFAITATVTNATGLTGITNVMFTKNNVSVPMAVSNFVAPNAMNVVTFSLSMTSANAHMLPAGTGMGFIDYQVVQTGITAMTQRLLAVSFSRVDAAMISRIETMGIFGQRNFNAITDFDGTNTITFHMNTLQGMARDNTFAAFNFMRGMSSVDIMASNLTMIDFSDSDNDPRITFNMTIEEDTFASFANEDGDLDWNVTFNQTNVLNERMSVATFSQMAALPTLGMLNILPDEVAAVHLATALVNTFQFTTPIMNVPAENSPNPIMGVEFTLEGSDRDNGQGGANPVNLEQPTRFSINRETNMFMGSIEITNDNLAQVRSLNPNSMGYSIALRYRFIIQGVTTTSALLDSTRVLTML